MTDRVHSLTVVLQKDIRVDDVQPLIDAIQHLRGVLSVTTAVADLTTHMAQERADAEWRERIYDRLLRRD